ncbi:MAG TPA: hypothetical protein PLV45_17225, partial [bacterium]|nr:hypothetical protein [bacterium]
MFILSFIRKNLQTRAERNAAFARLSRCRRGEWSGDTDLWVSDHMKHPDWEVRNIAVKLVGMRPIPSLAGAVTACLLDRNEPGFIRRNSATALRQLDTETPEILAGLRR